jgi:hypothetical protein
MSYESDCNIRAEIMPCPICGVRAACTCREDALDLEEKACPDNYATYDGWGDLDQYTGLETCADCGAHGLCECWRDELDLEDQVDMMLSDVCPICGDHDPYACECGCNDPDAVPF